MCEKEYEDWNNLRELICPECAESIFDLVGDMILRFDEKIMEGFNISTNPQGEVPPLDCKCGYHNILAMDYFTPKLSNGKYGLSICGVCRSCGGYRVVIITEALFPIEIKKPPTHLGMTINKISKRDSFFNDQIMYR